MIGTPCDIVAAIRATLSERVLPQLEQATWLAGDIRSSLVLLTYLEDVLTHGREALGCSNAAMIGFLSDVCARRDVSFLSDTLRTRATAAVENAQRAEKADVHGLGEASNELKAAISEIIAASNSRGKGSADAAAVLGLRDCLRVVAAQEQILAGRAGTMPPF